MRIIQILRNGHVYERHVYESHFTPYFFENMDISLNTIPTTFKSLLFILHVHLEGTASQKSEAPFLHIDVLYI